MLARSPLPGTPEGPPSDDNGALQPILRYAHGERFDLLLECIGDRIADEPRLRLEGQQEDASGPMLFSAMGKELGARPNSDILSDLSLSREEFMSRLAERVPSIRRERPVMFSRLRHSRTNRGVHFFELTLDGPSLEEARDERVDIWQALQGMTGTRLNWKPFVPDVTVVYGSNRPEPLDHEDIKPLKEYIRAHMPLDGILTPVVDAPL